MRRLLSMLALAAGIGLPAASAQAASIQASTTHSGSFGVRLYDDPAAEAHNSRGLRYIIDFLHPGSVIHRRILVLNQESKAATFAVYADTARIRNGSFAGDAGATRSELTTWIRVQHPVLRLRPGESGLDMITIRVPRGRAATRGGRYGVIWVQQSALGQTAAGSQFRAAARVGVRVYLDVGRGGAPPTRFRITSVTGRTLASGQPVLLARVANIGGRAVDLAGTASLSGGPGGAAVRAVAERQVLTLAPGQAGNLTFAEPRGVPAGPWHARVRLVSGFASAGAGSVIDFAGSGSSGLPWAIWLPGLLLGLALVSAAVLRCGSLAGRVTTAGRARCPRAGGVAGARQP